MTADRHQLRIARNLTSKTLFEVADAVGLGRTALSKIEDGTAPAEDEAIMEKLTAYFEAAGAIFHEGGRVELRPGLQRLGGQKVH